MEKSSQITQEHFDGLLVWLSQDRETAGQKYETIRSGLIRFFRYRGCDDPEELADETINRVARKLSAFNFDNDVKTITYFYSFASKIYLEDLTNKRRKWVPLDPIHDAMLEQIEPDVEKERRLKCLEKCLSIVPHSERSLLIRYYSSERAEKLRIRKELAAEINLSAAALHTRVHRLRTSLRSCADACLGQAGL